MKNNFIGFYNPIINEIENSWEKGIFAFDANTLLNLYRYTEATRNDFLNVLSKVKDRTFLPYQAAFEFHSNRVSTIKNLKNSYEKIYDFFENNFNTNIKSELKKFEKHPLISIEKINNLNQEFQEKLRKELDKQFQKHPDYLNEDFILESLTSIFENKIGKQFSEEEMKKIFDEGRKRYSEKIPPGFKDLENKKGKSEIHIYGDLIIWKELIKEIKSKKREIIFVTDDRKEDWWTIEKGETIRPREELIKEFFDLTGIRILIYNADNFLKYAKEKGFVTSIKDTSIEEIKYLRKYDEILDENLYSEFQKQILNNIEKQAGFSVRSKYIIPKELLNKSDLRKTLEDLGESNIYIKKRKT